MLCRKDWFCFRVYNLKSAWNVYTTITYQLLPRHSIRLLGQNVVEGSWWPLFLRSLYNNVRTTRCNNSDSKCCEENQIGPIPWESTWGTLLTFWEGPFELRLGWQDVRPGKPGEEPVKQWSAVSTYMGRYLHLKTGDTDISLLATPIFDQQANVSAYLGVIWKERPALDSVWKGFAFFRFENMG